MTEKKTTAKKTTRKPAAKKTAEKKMTIDMLFIDDSTPVMMQCEKYGIKDLPLKRHLTISERTAILRGVEDSAFDEDEYIPEVAEMVFRAQVFSAYSGIEIGDDADKVYNVVMDASFWNAFINAGNRDISDDVYGLYDAFNGRIAYRERMKAAQQEARLNEMFAVLQNANAQVEKLAEDMTQMDVSSIVEAVQRLEHTISDNSTGVEEDE